MSSTFVVMVLLASGDAVSQQPQQDSYNFGLYVGLSVSANATITVVGPRDSTLQCNGGADGPNCHNLGAFNDVDTLSASPWLVLGGRYVRLLLEAHVSSTSRNRDGISLLYRGVLGYRVHDGPYGDSFFLGTLGREPINFGRASSENYAVGLGIRHVLPVSDFARVFVELTDRMMRVREWQTWDDGYGYYNKSGLINIVGLNAGILLGY